ADSSSSTAYRFAADCIRFHAARRSASVTPFTLVEARNRVAYVRGIFQRLLALLRKRELGCGHPITSWLGQLCHYFSPPGAPCAWALRTRSHVRLWQLFKFLPPGLVGRLFP